MRRDAGTALFDLSAHENDVLGRAPFVAFTGENQDAMTFEIGEIRGRRR
ncbi:hypothetical protein ACCT14_06820 [Rhizobium brockwellii]